VLQTLDGTKMYIDKDDSLALFSNGIYEAYETFLIKALLKPTDIALDIGAHIGYFTLLMAQKCKWVYAFEPEPNNFKLLKSNVKLNKLENIVCYNIAVTESTGLTKLHLCESNSGMHRIYKPKWISKTTMVRTIKIDDALTLHGGLKVDFIKMDIEGSEFGALKGMEQLLKTNHVIMMMEFHPPTIEEYGANPREVYDFIKGLGYDIRLLPKPSIPISFEDLDRETRINSGRNVLCLEKEYSPF